MKNKIINAFFFLIVIFSFLSLGTLSAQAAEAENFGLPTDSLKIIINRAIDWLLGIAAGLTVLIIIIGGVYYVTAAGDESRVETGKKMITYAVIGLFLIGVSYAIVKAIDKIIGGA